MADRYSTQLCLVIIDRQSDHRPALHIAGQVTGEKRTVISDLTELLVGRKIQLHRQSAVRNVPRRREVREMRHQETSAIDIDTKPFVTKPLEFGAKIYKLLRHQKSFRPRLRRPCLGAACLPRVPFLSGTSRGIGRRCPWGPCRTREE